MKAIFWICIIGCVFTAINVITGVNEYQFGTSGSSVSQATTLERVLNGVAAILFGLCAYGIKEKRMFGWWIGTVFLGLVTLGLLSNILHAIGEEDVVFQILIVVSQVGAAAIAFLIWLKWWRPKKAQYFESTENIEQVASRNPDKPVS